MLYEIDISELDEKINEIFIELLHANYDGNIEGQEDAKNAIIDFIKQKSTNS